MIKKYLFSLIIFSLSAANGYSARTSLPFHGSSSKRSCKIPNGIKKISEIEKLDHSELQALFRDGVAHKSCIPLRGTKNEKLEVPGKSVLVLGTNRLNSNVITKVWSGKVFRSNNKGKVFVTNRILSGFSDRLDAGKANLVYTKSKAIHKDGSGVIFADYSRADERVLRRFRDELRVVGGNSKKVLYLGRTSFVLFGIGKTVAWYVLEVPVVKNKTDTQSLGAELEDRDLPDTESVSVNDAT